MSHPAPLFISCLAPFSFFLILTQEGEIAKCRFAPPRPFPRENRLAFFKSHAMMK